MSVGARGLIDIFGLKQDHSGLVKADFTTAAAAITDRIHRLGADSGDKIVEQTDWSYDENGVPSLKISQTDFGEEFEAFVNIMAPKKVGATSVQVSEKTAENGRKIGGSNSAGDAKNAIIIHYGSITEGGKIPVTVNIVYFKKTTGGRTTKGGEYVSPGVEAVGIAAKANIVIPKELLDADIVQASNDLSLPKDYYEKIFFLNPKP